MVHQREANPYWKDGGEGVPSENKEANKPKGIGDQGAGWRYKAFLRAKEKAEEEGLDVVSVLKERFGDEAEVFLKQQEQAQLDQRNEQRDRRDYSRKDYSGMRVPSQSSDLRWRRSGSGTILHIKIGFNC